MFTGIITDVGRVVAVAPDAGGDGRRMTIETRLPLAEIPLGGSIATSGICFTAVDKGADWFSVDASGATLEVTTAGRWQEGDAVNLERSLRIGDELGGHIVFGHVDAVGTVEALASAGDSHRLEIAVPASLAPLIAVKGSIAVDGISLTVNEVTDAALRLQHHPAQLAPHQPRRAGDGRSGQPRGRHARPLRRPPAGLPGAAMSTRARCCISTTS